MRDIGRRKALQRKIGMPLRFEETAVARKLPMNVKKDTLLRAMLREREVGSIELVRYKNAVQMKNLKTREEITERGVGSKVLASALKSIAEDESKTHKDSFVFLYPHPIGHKSMPEERLAEFYKKRGFRKPTSEEIKRISRETAMQEYIAARFLVMKGANKNLARALRREYIRKNLEERT